MAFDLQIEAEVLGCELAWADQTPPAVQPSFGQRPQAGGLRVPTPECGRINTVLSAARQLNRSHGDVALYGLVTGPFTPALHLLGTDIFTRCSMRRTTWAGSWRSAATCASPWLATI